MDEQYIKKERGLIMNQSTEEKAILIPIAMLLNIGLIFLYPLAIMLLWNWFITPYFEIAAITYLIAFGVYLLWCVLPKPSFSTSGQPDWINGIAVIITNYLKIGFVIVVALIFKGFM